MLARRLILPLMVLAVMLSTAPVNAQQQNLLANPSFELPYLFDLRNDGGGAVAAGWSAWWYNDRGDDYDGPEYKQATVEIDPSRVRSGASAQQYFRAWALHMAGLYQRVEVPAGSAVRFSIYGHAWASFCKLAENVVDCHADDSTYGGVNPMTMQVGIDPTGGTDPFSDTVIWSAGQAVYDQYGLFTVEAKAVREHVTVFVYSTPQQPTAAINVYWDDASLVVIDGGGVANSPGTGIGPGSLIQRQAPRPDGSLWHIVQDGESLGGIAFAYGVETQTIRDLNNLTSDIIYPGLELLIIPASAATPDVASPEANVIPSTSEATEVAETAATGSICLTVFADVDGDGQQTLGEPLLEGAELTLQGGTVDRGEISQATGPTCFENLSGSEYTLSIGTVEGYRIEDSLTETVTLMDGQHIALSFAAALTEEALQEGTSIKPRSKTLPIILAILAGLIGIGMAVGSMVMMLRSYRGSQT